MSGPYPDVEIERHDMPIHAIVWAVFSGAEGDDPHLCAIFFHREQAAAFVARCNDRACGDDDGAIFDPCIAPARFIDGALCVANDFRDEESAAQLMSLEEAP